LNVSKPSEKEGDMRLEAFVYCDCVEKKRLRIPHPYPPLLYISANGCPKVRTKDPALMREHTDWKKSNPCKPKHEGLMIAGYTLENAWWITQIREILEASLNSRSRYPVLLGKVFYCSTHACDRITVAQVRRLESEIQTLRKNLRDFSAEDRKFIVPTITALGKLVRASLRIEKPIAF
jgi:hypothetical protein